MKHAVYLNKKSSAILQRNLFGKGVSSSVDLLSPVAFGGTWQSGVAVGGTGLVKGKSMVREWVPFPSLHRTL